jgi:hypothetical protein
MYYSIRVECLHAIAAESLSLGLINETNENISFVVTGPEEGQ